MNGCNIYAKKTPILMSNRLLNIKLIFYEKNWHPLRQGTQFPYGHY